MKTPPKLTLIGAGPGDPELISIKGINALAKANVILYDALVNPKLLNFSPASTLKINVGKRKGFHTYTQDQINCLIVDLSMKYGNIVRLKGGDPFVFGRGQEELEHAAKNKLETEYIPGISSAVSVPGLQGIPLTHRGLSESFWVITGTTSSGELSADVYKAADNNSTVVILMGLSRLAKIAEIYKKKKKSETPVAIIQNGSLPEEKIVTGTFSTIENLAKENRIQAPAVIVIGEVVRFHPGFPTKPLSGNNLFPIFLKLDRFNVLIVGGGATALEKTTAILNNSPFTSITLLAEKILPEIVSLSKSNKNIHLLRKIFEAEDIRGKDVIISAVNNKNLSKEIYLLAKSQNILINVADTPDLCDFFLSSIVKKGDLKIAISTNGKSPTFAKRVKEVLNDSFPEETQEILNNLAAIRNHLKGDFHQKVIKLNQLTSVLVNELAHNHPNQNTPLQETLNK